MTKSISLPIAAIVLVISVQTVLAQVSTENNGTAANPNSFVVTGDPNEILDLTVYSDPRVVVDGVITIMPAEACDFSVIVEAMDPRVSDPYVTSQTIALAAGKADVVSIPFSEVSAPDGVAVMVVTFEVVSNTGPCEEMLNSRIAGPDGATRTGRVIETFRLLHTPEGRRG